MCGDSGKHVFKVAELTAKLHTVTNLFINANNVYTYALRRKTHKDTSDTSKCAEYDNIYTVFVIFWRIGLIFVNFISPIVVAVKRSVLFNLVAVAS